MRRQPNPAEGRPVHRNVTASVPDNQRNIRHGSTISALAPPNATPKPNRRAKAIISLSGKNVAADSAIAASAPFENCGDDRGKQNDERDDRHWRRQFGVEPAALKELAPILPVTIAPDTTAADSDLRSTGQMEIVLAEGDRIIVWADVETAALSRVVKALRR